MPPSEGFGIREAATSDTRAVHDLLLACKLPVDGVPGDLTLLLVAEQEGRVVGSAGLELHGSDGLLRSVAVSPELRAQGIAGALCDEVERRAASLGARRLYLLTETAEQFFQRRGYRLAERTSAPTGIASSREFAAVCPASARLMLRELPREQGTIAIGKLDPAEVCTLPKDGLAERLAWIREEILPHACRSERLESGFAWELDAAPGLAEKVDRLIALERECCSSIVFERTDASLPGRLRLEVRGVDPDAAVFRALRVEHQD